MCTVSFIAKRDSYIITSNRDEKISRKQALPPAIYEFEGGKLIFPKDADAGGSWIALHENGNAAVLLNGAFEKHKSAPSYRMSRGKIFLNIITSENPIRGFDLLDLNRIEPFTLVMIDRDDLYECRWDGNIKYCNQLRNDRRYIWSSTTLYEKEMIIKRAQWFAEFLNCNPDPSWEDILNFHKLGGDHDRSNDLQMERHGLYSTVSIASILRTSDQGSMKYLDLKDNSLYESRIKLTSDLDFA